MNAFRPRFYDRPNLPLDVPQGSYAPLGDSDDDDDVEAQRVPRARRAEPVDSPSIPHAQMVPPVEPPAAPTLKEILSADLDDRMLAWRNENLRTRWEREHYGFKPEKPEFGCLRCVFLVVTRTLTLDFLANRLIKYAFGSSAGVLITIFTTLLIMLFTLEAKYYSGMDVNDAEWGYFWKSLYVFVGVSGGVMVLGFVGSVVKNVCFSHARILRRTRYERGSDYYRAHNPSFNSRDTEYNSDQDPDQALMYLVDEETRFGKMSQGAKICDALSRWFLCPYVKCRCWGRKGGDNDDDEKQPPLKPKGKRRGLFRKKGSTTVT